jgi:hypothetical protein
MEDTTWTIPEDVAEQHIEWSRIVTGKDNVIHRLWQGIDIVSNRSIVYHQYSRDEGNSWSSAETISSLHLLGPGDLSVDSAGLLNLVLSVEHSTGEIGLEHWIWSGERWSSYQGLKLEESGIITVDSLSTTITASGKLGVLYSGTILTGSQNLLQNAGRVSERINYISYTSRDLDILSVIMAPQPDLTQSPLITTVPTVQVTPDLNPTNEIPVLDEDGLVDPWEPSTENTWGGLILGAGLAVALVTVAFGINAKRMGRG